MEKFMLSEVVVIFIGGGLGAVLRYLVTRVSHYLCGYAHLGTFVVNIVGCFLIGYVFGIMLDRVSFSNELKLFITVGFLGGLTTFSTFNNETFCLLKDGKYALGLGYMLLSCLFGLAFTLLGYHLGK